jgi:hypothetical protein
MKMNRVADVPVIEENTNISTRKDFFLRLKAHQKADRPAFFRSADGRAAAASDGKRRCQHPVPQAVQERSRENLTAFFLQRARAPIR